MKLYSIVFHIFCLQLIPDFEFLYDFSKKKLMFNFWKEILRHNLAVDEIKYVFNDLFPYYKMNQKIFFYDPSKKVEFSNEQIYGTKEIQNLILKNQFPKNCSDRNFILSPQHYSGIGSMIHVFGSALAKGMNENRTVINHPHFFPKFSQSHICKRKPGLDCFLIPISNCSFSEKEILSNPKRFTPFDIPRLEIPKAILPIIQKTATPKSLYYFYWRIQAAYFMVHFNNITKRLIDDFRKKHLINPKSQYDVSLHIRHGDKHREMPLIKTDFYLYPLEILFKLFNRRLSVFISSDDQSAVNFFDSIDKKKFDISYFDFQRQKNGYNLKRLSNGFNNSIQSFSNLIESINSHYLIGTLQSNWNRLILELRLQYQPEMELPYFEVGGIRCVTPIQCKHFSSDLYFDW